MSTVSPPSIRLPEQPFYISDPLLNALEELKDAKEAFVTIKKHWSEHAKKLTPSSRKLFLGLISGMVASSLERLQKIIDNEDSLREFREEAKNSLGDLNDTAKCFLRNRAVYQEQKDKVLNEIDRFDWELQAKQLSFDSFEPSSQRTPNPPQDNKDFQSIFTDWTNGKISDHIHHVKGPLRAQAYDMIAYAILAPKPEDRSSPYRDLLVSYAVSTSISQAVQALLATTNATACTVMAMADTISYGAQRAQPTINRLAQNREVAECWNRAWLYSGQEGMRFESAVSAVSCSLQLAQVPAKLMDYVQSETTDFLAYASDSIGLTDEKMDQVVQDSLEHLAKYSPALLEPEFWEDRS